MLSDRSFDFVRNNANRQQGQQSCQFVLPEQQPQRQQRIERNQNKALAKRKRLAARELAGADKR